MGSAGRTFGRYVLIDRLASGRSSEIWLARMRGPQRFKKLAAIKRMTLGRDALAARTFVEEGTLAARLSHPHIAQVFEMGEENGWCYMAMEYVAGQTLRSVLSRTEKVLTPGHVAEIFAQLCSALASAHDAGVVHRDVHPWNVLVSYTGDVKLVDFGSATSDASDRTEIEAVARRVPYMSPEQCKGEPVDARSDIFAVAVSLYEALSGKNPFARVNPVEAMDAVCRKKVGPVSRYNPAFAAFDAIIAKALHKDPRRRYRNCREMANELKALAFTERSLGAVMRRSFKTELVTERRLAEWEDSSADVMPTTLPAKTVPRLLGPLAVLFGGGASRQVQAMALGGAFAITVLTTASVTHAVMADKNPPPAAAQAAAPESMVPKLSELTVVSDNKPAPSPPVAPQPAPSPAASPAAVADTEPELSAPPRSLTRPAAAPAKPTEVTPTAIATPAPSPISAPSPHPRPKRIAKNPVHSWMNDPTPDAVDDGDE